MSSVGQNPSDRRELNSMNGFNVENLRNFFVRGSPISHLLPSFHSFLLHVVNLASEFDDRKLSPGNVVKVRR
jgi:hypothetical protein